MKLKRVQIKNFRSIKDAEINFDPNCRVLVGINESGKSNILRALSLLSDEYEPSPEDVREPLPDESESDQDSYVRFIFDTSELMDDLISGINTRIYNGGTNIL